MNYWLLYGCTIKATNMKHYSLLRLAAFSVIFVTAMAFSCQDHHIPDPVTNCNRVNGTPRAVNCEFEFVKADFYEIRSGIGDTVRYGTVTPTSSPTIQLKEVEQGRWILSYVSMFYYIPIDVTVTIKRIAPAPSASKSYLLRQDLAVYPGEVEFPTTKDFYPPADEDLTPVNIDIPVGGTYTYNTVYHYVGNAGYSGDDVNYGLNQNYYLLVQNVETSKMLTQAPYNYNFFRDKAEAKLMFRTKIIPGICFFCKKGG